MPGRPRWRKSLVGWSAIVPRPPRQRRLSLCSGAPMPRHRAPAALAAAALFVTLLAACGDDSEGAADSTTTTAAGAASCDTLPLKEDGTLTVATGEPAFEPWVVDDDPTNQEGFEAAVVYAVADELGIGAADVTWTRT